MLVKVCFHIVHANNNDLKPFCSFEHAKSFEVGVPGVFTFIAYYEQTSVAPPYSHILQQLCSHSLYLAYMVHPQDNLMS